MAKSMTLKQFLARFPDDEACLEHLFKVRYGSEPICPKCGQIDTFHRLRKLRAYTCNCGHHVHPTAGTATIGLAYNSELSELREIADELAATPGDLFDGIEIRLGPEDAPIFAIDFECA